MRKTINRLLTLVVLAAGAGACDGGPRAPTQPPAFVGPAEIQITDLTVGTGATLVVGQTITANYQLWLYDPTRPEQKGTRIDGGQITRPLNSASLIQGWVVGLPGMRVGGVRRLLIPPSMAYGTTGSGPIPPNAWLVFDVELLAAN